MAKILQLANLDPNIEDHMMQIVRHQQIMLVEIPNYKASSKFVEVESLTVLVQVEVVAVAVGDPKVLIDLQFYAQHIFLMLIFLRLQSYPVKSTMEHLD